MDQPRRSFIDLAGRLAQAATHGSAGQQSMVSSQQSTVI
jgi:hypothetical protein